MFVYNNKPKYAYIPITAHWPNSLKWTYFNTELNLDLSLDLM